MDDAEVGHLGDAAVLLGRGVGDRREDAEHRVVDPGVDRTELRLGALGGVVDRGGVGDVERQHQRAAAELLHLAGGGLEALPPARQQGDAITTPRELAHRGATDPGRGAGDDHDSRLGSGGRLGHLDRYLHANSPPTGAAVSTRVSVRFAAARIAR
jgi:hypothetical protein